MKIKIFTTGGTIDKVYFDALSDYQVGVPGVREILEDLPIEFSFDIESLMKKDSLEMNDTDRQQIRQRVEGTDSNKVLITHGTDRMIETARALTPRPGQCVVLTGALAPAKFKTSDAEFNVGMAIGVLASVNDGVHIVMNGCRFDPWRCRKDRQAQRFEHTSPPTT